MNLEQGLQETNVRDFLNRFKKRFLLKGLVFFETFNFWSTTPEV